MLVLFKVNAFPFKNKDKSHIFHAKATFTLCSAAPCLFCFEAICDRYFFKLNCFKLIGWFNHASQCFSTNQISLLQIFALWLQKIALWLQKIALWLQKIALWLQKIALLFGINCSEINQSQSSNIFMYIIKRIIHGWMLGNTRFISCVEHDISRVSAANEWDIMFNTRNKSGISKHPCIFLFII